MAWNQLYSKIQYKYESGHLFQGRYKGILLENDAYLLRLPCYIHRNPLRAGISERLDFIKDIKSRFLDVRKDVELPQQNSLFRDFDIDFLINNTAKILGLNIKSVYAAKRISAGDKDKQDLLIYLLWKTGRFSNREIGKRFGLTYSAVSQRVKMMSSRLPIEKILRNQYALLKSQINV